MVDRLGGVTNVVDVHVSRLRAKIDRGFAASLLYLDGRLAGVMRQPVRIWWMNPDAPIADRDAAIFLGVNYVGGIDDLRVYRTALTEQSVRMLHSVADHDAPRDR